MYIFFGHNINHFKNINPKILTEINALLTFSPLKNVTKISTGSFVRILKKTS